jgi:hypothetical protein
MEREEELMLCSQLQGRKSSPRVLKEYAETWEDHLV